MGHSVTLGGERVGSGNKNKIYLHNYERSTHNLSEKFTSSLGVGMLVPFLCIPATRDDKFEIDLSAGLRTIPTKGPLFGSFKLQLDVYQCPWRLYQALLHNNPLAIGLKANQVKFPKMRLKGYVTPEIMQSEYGEDAVYYPIKAARNSLVRYLGIAGIGSAHPSTEEQGYIFARDVTGSHLLAYYDIFKNYYANKQEENAFTLASQEEKVGKYPLYVDYVTASASPMANFSTTEKQDGVTTIKITSVNPAGYAILTGHFDNKVTKEEFEKTYLYVYYGTSAPNTYTAEGSLKELKAENIVHSYDIYDNNNFVIRIWRAHSITVGEQTTNIALTKIEVEDTIKYQSEIVLKPFKLSNIDDMRMAILSEHTLGYSFFVDGQDYAPYNTNFKLEGRYAGWQKPLTGLCVKTYQSDLFNNWVNTEWIDGENGIAAITAISTSDGKITIDALNFSEKLYNLLNRIAISGATYEDYLDAAYTDSAKKFCEAPMWIGGMSDEIVFEEIVQTAPTDDSALGSLGGRGNLLGHKKGGKITVKVDEPSWIIGIVSITPRIQYTQGIEWYNTEIDSLQDLHVPALDGIAFQNLMGSQLHFGADELDQETYEPVRRQIIGKVPAWINYMTAVDKAFGDFAGEDGDAYMILNRNYGFDTEDGRIQDATTYIDPAKFNYAFAYTKRDAQNFWVQIISDIKARRLMSAKQIPNV